MGSARSQKRVGISWRYCTPGLIAGSTKAREVTARSASGNVSLDGHSRSKGAGVDVVCCEK